MRLARRRPQPRLTTMTITKTTAKSKARAPASSNTAAPAAPKRAKREKAPPAAAPELTATAPTAPAGKLGILVGLLKRPEGASVEDMSSATGWQFHSVRGAMSGALKKKEGFTIISEKTGGGRLYRIPSGDAA